MSLGPISISKLARAHFPTIQPVTPIPSTRVLPMFQQQYTASFKGTKPKGATLQIPLQLRSGGVRLLPSNKASPSMSSMFFMIGSIPFLFSTRFLDAALRGQHDKPYNRFRQDQQAGLFAGDRNSVSGRILL
jgi:hypothetical protein